MAAVHDLYRAQLLRSRAEFLGSLTELKGKAVAELNVLAGELDGLLEAQVKKGVISADRLRFIEGRIEMLVPGTTGGIKSLLDNQIRVSVETAATAKQKGAGVFSYFVKAAAKEKGILKVPEINVAFGGGMANFSEELVKQVWDKRWADGKKLSQRIWNFNRITEKDLLRKVKLGVEEGKAAREVSKGLRGYLTGMGKGSPVFRSMRIARTECNEAYNLAHDEIAKRESFVKGTKWNLSASHKKTDVCDDYAEGGPTGDGVYPVGEVPTTPHPTCLCFRTDVIPTVEEFLNRQVEVPEYGWVDKAEILDKEYEGYLQKASSEIKPVGFNRISKMNKYVPHRPSGAVPMRGATEPITGNEAVGLTRKNYMRKLGFAKERVYIERALDGWVFDVNSPRACWLRAGINKMHRFPWKEGLSQANVESLNNIIAGGYLPKIDDKAVRAIKAYKAYTQALMKNRGLKSQVAWRGITGEQAKQVARAALSKDMAKIDIRSLSSFTNIEDIATDFANQEFVGGPSIKRVLDKGVVFKTTIKAENVFLYPEAGGNLPPVVAEAEILLTDPKRLMLIDKNNIKIGSKLLKTLVKR